MSNDREKEIKHLMYIKNEIIKQEKKSLKLLREELLEIQGTKNLNKPKIKVKRK